MVSSGGTELLGSGGGALAVSDSRSLRVPSSAQRRLEQSLSLSRDLLAAQALA